MKEDGEWLEEGESEGRGGDLLGLFAYRMGEDKDGGRGKEEYYAICSCIQCMGGRRGPGGRLV